MNKRLSYGKIQCYLKKQKISSPQGNPTWCTSSIGALLKTSAYRGLAYYGVREQCDPDPTRLPSRQVRFKERTTPKRGVRKRDSSKWIGIPVPRIVSDELFELAQDLRSRNKSLSTRNTKEGSLLQGLLSCKECGYAFKNVLSGKKSKGYRYYTCSKRRANCKNRSIRIEKLDEAIWKSLIKVLESPELIQKEVGRRMSELKKAPVQEKQVQLEKNIKRLDQESNRLLDAFQEGCIEITQLKSRINAINREINNTKREIVNSGTGLNKEQLLELNEAIKYFSVHVKNACGNLRPCSLVRSTI